MTQGFPSRPVPAAAGVVFRGEEVLLIRRKASPFAGRWSLPGGAVELGETVHDAVIREVREETGLDVEPIEVVGVYDNIVTEGERIRFHYLLVDFLCRPIGGELRPGTDASAGEWVPLADLAEVDLTPLARRAIEEARRFQDGSAGE